MKAILKAIICFALALSFLLAITLTGNKLDLLNSFSSEKGIIRAVRETFPYLYKNIVKTIHEYDKELPGIRRKLQLPLFELTFSRKDIAHFSNLYQMYEKSPTGHEYYKRNNSWRKAKLYFEGKAYRIKIRAHGRRPNFHRAGRFISFAIKLKQGEQIRNARKFSLIIRERIRPERHLILYLADWFNIIRQQEELVGVRINNWDEKLYYFEHRLDEPFMEVQKKSSFQIVETNSKSSIFINIDPEEHFFDHRAFQEQFMNSMEGIDLSATQKTGMLKRYLALNSAIALGNYKHINNYFELDYIASFEAARTIAGCMGHGLGEGNLYVFLDTANGKFYPAISRDNVPSLLRPSDGYPIERQINFSGSDSMRLFHLLTANDTIRQEKYRKIYDYIIREQRNSAAKYKEIIEENFKLHYLGYVFRGLQRHGVNIFPNILSHNLTILRSYLETANPEVKATPFGEGILLEVKPHSNAVIRFSRLNVRLNSSGRLWETKVEVRVYAEYPDRIEAIGKSSGSISTGGQTINLSRIVEKLQFSDAVDEECERIQRKYLLYVFLTPENRKETFSIETIDLAFQNTVTKMPINSVPVTIENSLLSSWEEMDNLVTSTDSEFEAVKRMNRDLDISYDKTSGDLTIHSGTYKIEHDIILPPKAKLVIDPGTTLLLGKDVLILGYNGMDVNGTAAEPVTITSLAPEKPFGSIGILGDGNSESNIRYLHLSNGRERWFQGAYFSGGLSIHYNKNVTISDSVFRENHADDGINIKYCNNVLITNCTFTDNFADQIDLDYCDGSVTKSRFMIKNILDNNGDGLDISGSQIVVKECVFSGFKDKGISVGEHSNILITHSSFQGNQNGIAVKDLSHAFFVENTFTDNSVDINMYQKKGIYGGGGIAFFPLSEKQPTYSVDKKSSFREFPGDKMVDEIKRAEDMVELQEILTSCLSGL